MSWPALDTARFLAATTSSNVARAAGAQARRCLAGAGGQRAEGAEVQSRPANHKASSPGSPRMSLASSAVMASVDESGAMSSREDDEACDGWDKSASSRRSRLASKSRHRCQHGHRSVHATRPRSGPTCAEHARRTGTHHVRGPAAGGRTNARAGAAHTTMSPRFSTEPAGPRKAGAAGTAESDRTSPCEAWMETKCTCARSR